MDLELLEALALVLLPGPAHREAIASPAAEHRVAWPVPLRGKNVVVEAVGAGLRQPRSTMPTTW